jgi:uncharacterized Zn-binding protein involved in type VI secretion
MSPPICLGDTTSGGGEVIACQFAATHRLNGRPIAVIGDTATCPTHGGTFAFVEGHPHRKRNGVPIVLQGHRLACGCHAMASNDSSMRIS